MNEFPPARERGLIVHGVLLFLLAVIFGLALALISLAPVGPLFTAYVLVAVGTFIPLPFLAYRAYALLRANYTLDRDTLRLTWGLRAEAIPISDVEWVRPAGDLSQPLRLPFLPLPGGLIGTTRHPDLGLVEFLAADASADKLLLIATRQQVFAISPANSHGFVDTFQHAIEQGSLERGAGQSQYPSFVIVQAWARPLTRYLWVSGALLNIGLLIWITTLIPSLQKAPMGFTPALEPLIATSPVQLILLPVLSALLFIVGWIAGLYWFRWDETRPLSFVLWASGTLSTLLFLVATLFLLTTPV